MPRKNVSKHRSPKPPTTVRPTVERLPDLRVAAIPPTPSLQAAIALVFFSITQGTSGSDKSS
jgi:hypothetical protein